MWEDPSLRIDMPTPHPVQHLVLIGLRPPLKPQVGDVFRAVGALVLEVDSMAELPPALGALDQPLTVLVRHQLGGPRPRWGGVQLRLPTCRHLFGLVEMTGQGGEPMAALATRGEHIIRGPMPLSDLPEALAILELTVRRRRGRGGTVTTG